MRSVFPWEQLNRVVLRCGEVHEEHSFGANAVEQLHQLVPYDQARVYFFNDSARVYDQVLIGVDRQTVEDYFSYYAKLENGYYDVAQRVRLHHTQPLPVLDWARTKKPDQFQREHLRPQGIRFSTGLLLSDLYGSPRVLFCLDRTGSATSSQLEMEVLSCLSAHLNNLYRNFYAVANRSPSTPDTLAQLTPGSGRSAAC